MKSLLIHARPFRFSTGQRVDIRIGSAADATALGLGNYTWESAVVRRPRFSLDLLTEEMDGKLQAGRGDFVINLESVKQIDDAGALFWGGAPVTVYDADGLDYPTMPVEFTGTVREAVPDLETNHLTLNLQVNVPKLSRPLLGSTFSGAGGINGDAGKRGVLKPAGFGLVRDVEPVMFDETDNIAMVDGYGNLLDVFEIFEGANSLGVPVANYPTYAALKAAIIAGQVPKGRAATCTADGCIGLGAPPAGVITADCRFGFNRSGAWIRRLLEYHAGIPTAEIDTVALNALDQIVNRPVHYWTDRQREVVDLVQAIAGACNANLLLTFQGKISIVRPFGGSNAGTIDRWASSVPPVTAWATADLDPPAWRMTARADRPGRVLSFDEVFYEDDLEDRGLFSLTETYRQGHTVWLQNGSQWLWINATPGSGRAPPAPPAESNADWQQLKPPTLASDLTYDDGTPIEDLKPAVPGATRQVPRGPWVAGQDSIPGDIWTHFGSAYMTTTAHTTDAGDPPPNVNMELFVERGATATPLLVQWSVNGVTGWHTDFVDGDLYLRTSADGGATWSAPAKVVGEGGGPGTTGNTDQFVFRRSASLPTTPTGNGIPSGWSDAPPPDNGQPLWMSVAEQTAVGVLVTAWSAPIKLTAHPLLVQWSVTGAGSWHTDYAPGDEYIRTSSDGGVTWSVPAKVVGEEGDVGPTGNVIQHVFKRSAAQPASPSGNGIPAGWADGPPADDGNALWMSTATQNAAGVLQSSWSAPVRLSAYVVRVQWSVDGLGGWHDAFALGDKYLRTSTDGGQTWSAAVKAVGENGDGAPGNVFQYVFTRQGYQPTTPSGNGIPAGWSDAPYVSTDPLWMSVAEQTDLGVLVGPWSTPVKLTGDTGAPGMGGLTFDLSTAVMIIQKDSGGATKGGQLPKTILCTLKAGDQDVSGAATFTVSAVGGNDAYKASHQIVRIDTVSGTGFVEVRCQYGAFDQRKRVEVTVQQDAPPVQQGAALQSTSSMGAITQSGATAYPVSPTYVLLVRSDGAGQLRARFSANYTVPIPAFLGAYTGNAAGKSGFRVAGSGAAWSDITAEATSSPAARGRRYTIAPGEPETEQRAGVLQQDFTRTGLTPNQDYEVGFFLRNLGTDAPGTHVMYGTMTAGQPGAFPA